MARNRGSSRREERKAPMELPPVPDLGAKLTMPRKTNRAAARSVASGDRFWDKRKVAAKARRRALELELARASRTGSHRLSRQQKQWMENHLTAWPWDSSTGALRGPAQPTTEQLDELVAATRLPYVRRALLEVQGICPEQMRYLAERAPESLRLVLLDPVTQGRQAIRVPRLGWGEVPFPTGPQGTRSPESTGNHSGNDYRNH